MIKYNYTEVEGGKKTIECDESAQKVFYENFATTMPAFYDHSAVKIYFSRLIDNYLELTGAL